MLKIPERQKKILLLCTIYYLLVLLFDRFCFTLSNHFTASLPCLENHKLFQKFKNFHRSPTLLSTINLKNCTITDKSNEHP